VAEVTEDLKEVGPNQLFSERKLDGTKAKTGS
jgi:hypothetical protein